MLEILHCALVSLGSFPRAECAQIAPSASLGILFARVKAIFARFQFSNHDGSLQNRCVQLEAEKDFATKLHLLLSSPQPQLDST
jgi:hypothetical protein